MLAFLKGKNTQNVKQSKSSELEMVTHPASRVSEQYRTLRANIQFSSVDNVLKTFVVTSAESGAGKSTIASNLALSFVSQGMKVLLIDADMRKPVIHNLFKLTNRDGLTTLLSTKGLDENRVIHKIGSSNLSVLTCGPVPPNPSELMASKRMLQLMDDLKKRFDLIIVDVPPIIAVADAQIMANMADGTIFVIRKGISTKESVMKAKELLEMSKATIIGSVFNGTVETEDMNSSYYGVEKKGHHDSFY